MGFNGRIYPVNPNVDEVLGLKAYPQVNVIDDNLEIVIMYKQPFGISKMWGLEISAE